MKFVKSVLSFDVYGKSVEVRFPTVKEVRLFQEKMKDKGDELTNTIEYLSVLGLPKEVAENMEMDHLQQIIESLISQKKS